MDFDEALGPNLLYVYPKNESLEKDESFSTLARLLVKVGMGSEILTKKLGGPITDESFQRSKLLYFSILMPVPDSPDVRFRKHGKLTTLFIEFSDDDTSLVLRSYKDLESLLIEFFKDNPVLEDIIKNLSELKGTLDTALGKSTLLSYFNNHLDEDDAFEMIGLITTDGRDIVHTPDPPPPYARAGLISTLQSLSDKVSKNLEPHSGNKTDVFINYRSDRITLAKKIENYVLYSYINRELADLRGIEVYITTLQRLSKEIFRLTTESDITTEKPTVMKIVRTFFPDVAMVILSSFEGIPIIFEEGDITITDEQKLTLSATVQAVLNIVLLESEKMGMDTTASDQIHLIRTVKDKIILIGGLSEKRAFTVVVPFDDKKVKIGDYIARSKLLIKRIKKFYQ